ncbi:hypothetical protein LXL04_023643 [Taraxacum kok-saghyz]
MGDALFPSFAYISLENPLENLNKTRNPSFPQGLFKDTINCVLRASSLVRLGFVERLNQDDERVKQEPSISLVFKSSCPYQTPRALEVSREIDDEVESRVDKFGFKTGVGYRFLQISLIALSGRSKATHMHDQFTYCEKDHPNLTESDTIHTQRKLGPRKLKKRKRNEEKTQVCDDSGCFISIMTTYVINKSKLNFNLCSPCH